MATSRNNDQPAIRISAKPKKPVLVELLGINYQIKTPKSALLLAISSHADAKDGEVGAINRDFQTILKLMFTAKDLPLIQARLNSAEDDLDIDHIFDAVEAITEETNSDPTS